MFDLVSLKVGSWAQFSENGARSISSSNSTVATAMLAEGVVTIKGVAAGVTVLTVMRSDGAVIMRPITVTP